MRLGPMVSCVVCIGLNFELLTHFLTAPVSWQVVGIDVLSGCKVRPVYFIFLLCCSHGRLSEGRVYVAPDGNGCAHENPILTLAEVDQHEAATTVLVLAFGRRWQHGFKVCREGGVFFIVCLFARIHLHLFAQHFPANEYT